MTHKTFKMKYKVIVFICVITCHFIEITILFLRLYLAGLDPQVEKLYPPVKMPVSQGTPSISPLVNWEHSVDWKTSAYDFTVSFID